MALKLNAATLNYVCRRGRYALRHGLRRGVTFGHCPICQRRTIFLKEGAWLRDQFKCARCFSIPRWRALIHVLETFFPEWRDMQIHESSPGGAASDKLAAECAGCIQTHYYPTIPPGQINDGFRCENLEAMTFADSSFDLVVTQDVFEHVLRPQEAFREISRTLKPGGAHVFTVPWYFWKPTLVRAIPDDAGGIQHIVEADYHMNPVDLNGSLVVREWGADLPDYIFEAAGMSTTAIHLHDVRQGISAKFIEVFISRKPHEAL